ncbi:MAG: HAD-IB family hydrolase [Gammaproteobacteria bacterium]|nr:HAD-IB family hydrolase [Gammaproteobacteria bacterium]MCW8923922.1 HAD-IB family hydrolase [Gammaproteobacteria bacterium]
MALALFDLDNTLLAGDSDYLWGCFLSDRGLVDKELYEQANLRFYEQYKQGTLDIHEFLNFALTPLAENDFDRLQAFHVEFMESIHEIMTEAGQARINQHREQGDYIVIITATNSFVTGPIAEAFGVDHLIATEPEIVDGQYTGKVAGTPCFQAGKITKLNEWLEQTGKNLEGSYFYSDSHNDLPLLEQVTHPIAVDPDEQLKAIAQERGWKIETFR